MRRATLVLPLIVTCIVLLAACGDSTSSSTATKTATVPSGQLGETDLNCPPPTISGVKLTTLSFLGITCRQAIGYAHSIVRTSKVAGWSCTRRDGSRVSVTCRNDADQNELVHVAWSVTA